MEMLQLLDSSQAHQVAHQAGEPPRQDCNRATAGNQQHPCTNAVNPLQ
jgi:hypothetical protein